MGQACVTARYDAPAEKLWSYLDWFGVEKLCGGSLFKSVEFEGLDLKPGIIRTLHLHDALPVRERLEKRDERDMVNVYRVIDVGSLPVTDYEGHIRITPAGPGACHVKINSTFTAVGISDDDWARLWETMEAQMLEDLRKLVEA